MINTYTFDRACAEVTAIIDRGYCSDPRVVDISGAVAGRESRPTYYYGHAVRYQHPDNGACLKFWPNDEIRDALRCVYVVDGVPMYVAGWQSAGDGTANYAADGYVILHPYGVDQRFMPHRAYFLTTCDVPADRFGDDTPQECGYCGGRAIRDEEGTGWMHADHGDRVKASPGDFVSARHNVAGSAVLAVDLVDAEG